MSKTTRKNFYRTVRKSKSRFFAVALIVALGVGFFCGLLSSAPDMRYSADAYFDEQYLADLQLISPLAFSTENIDAVEGLPQVETVMPNKTADVLTKTPSGDMLAARFFSLSEDMLSESTSQTPSLNHLSLLEGSLPQNAQECIIVLPHPSVAPNIQVGDTLILSDENKNLEDTFHRTEYRVSGIATSPLFFSIDRESTQIGNGSLNLIAYTFEENFALSDYNTLFVEAKDTRSLNTFSKEYDTKISSLKEEIKTLAQTQAPLQETSIRNELESNRENAQNQLTQLQSSGQSTPQTTEQIEQLQTEIGKAEQILSTLPTAQWHVLTRNEMNSYATFESNIDKVDAVSTVFPIFFFFIAALVSLTTMTRMVDEERTQIGTYKALGFTNREIMNKYLLYSAAPTVLGTILGAMIGIYLFPSIIWNVYTSMYRLPKFYLLFHVPYFIIATFFACICTLGACYSACRSTLKENASALLLPKAPTAGKRILLEYLPWVWKKFSFIHKVTARNLLRYKKRFFMTVVGIAGCTALLLTGFGLQDSLSNVLHLQFGEVFHYDLTISLQNEASMEDGTPLHEILSDSEKITRYLPTNHQNTTGKNNEQSIDFTLITLPQGTDYQNFLTLRQRLTHKEIPLSEDGIILGEKLAETLRLRVGDTISIENQGGKTAEIPIIGISENYIRNYAFMRNDAYEAYFKETYSPNTLLVHTPKNSENTIDSLNTTLLSTEGVSSTMLIRYFEETFENMLSKISIVVVVLILSAGVLAFIVLYNLTNINITERKKEIATIRVLGFTNRELSAYIYRESIVLTVFGILLGLVIGIGLHGFIIQNIEMENMMFGRSIEPISFLYSAALTFFFSFLVNWVMYPQITKINMVESLKAPE